MQAQIITIGDEILIGQIVDTNSAYIAERLNSIGIRVGQMLSVGDTRQAIFDALQQACTRADVIVVTGGLGPTNDDITKHTLAEFTDAKTWVQHQASLEIIESIAQRRGLPMNEQNRNQAMLPDTCEALLNRLGTAPGMWFEHGGKIIISMPGVPFEMQGLMDEVISRLQKRFALPPIYHRTIATYGLAESILAEKLAEWERALPEYIHLAYLPNPLSGVRLRFSVYNPEPTTEAEVEQAVVALRTLLGQHIYGEGTDTLATAVGRLLRERRATVSTAESCTGGKIASLLTAIAGSSAYFKGGVVAYDNSVKSTLLNVSPETIEKHGAVSLPVVEQMAEGARHALQTDYAVAVSGIAGPGGGTPEKPVGTVCIAVASPRGVVSQQVQLTGDRLRNIDRSAAMALNMLRLQIVISD